MKRRGFLKLLGIGTAAAVAPKVLSAPAPIPEQRAGGGSVDEIARPYHQEYSCQPRPSVAEVERRHSAKVIAEMRKGRAGHVAREETRKRRNHAYKVDVAPHIEYNGRHLF